MWTYPCACSPGGPQGTANDCRFRCTTCGHEAAMHNRCRDHCCEARCKCEQVTGVDMGPYTYLPNKEQKERNNDIWVRRTLGETYTAIAKDYNIGRERARQIFMKEQRKIERAPPAPKGEQEGTDDAAVACDSSPSGHTGEHHATQVHQRASEAHSGEKKR